MIKLTDLPYGSVIEYRKKRYFKVEKGRVFEDLLIRADGWWVYIEDLNWKKFKVLL